MSEKKIPREALDEAIAAVRHYYSTETPAGEKEALNEMSSACRRAESAAGTGVCIVSDLLGSILTYSGLKREATNQDIYKVLEVLGWQVVADGQAEH